MSAEMAAVDDRIVDWQTDYMIDLTVLQALGNDRRLPAAGASLKHHFPAFSSPLST